MPRIFAPPPKAAATLDQQEGVGAAEREQREREKEDHGEVSREEKRRQKGLSFLDLSFHSH